MNATILSDTILQCPTCRRRYRVADERLKSCRYSVRCGGCRLSFDARCARLDPRILDFAIFRSENAVKSGNEIDEPDKKEKSENEAKKLKAKGAKDESFKPERRDAGSDLRRERSNETGIIVPERQALEKEMLEEECFKKNKKALMKEGAEVVEMSEIEPAEGERVTFGRTFQLGIAPVDKRVIARANNKVTTDGCSRSAGCGVVQLDAFTLMEDSLTAFDCDGLLSSEPNSSLNVELSEANVNDVSSAHKSADHSETKPIAFDYREFISSDNHVKFENNYRIFSEALKNLGKERSVGLKLLSRLFLGLIIVVTATVFFQRNEFVGFFPSSYHVLKKISVLLGKNLSWPHKNNEISLRAVEIRLDQQDGNKLLLTGVLKNKSYQNLSFPYLEVNFLDDNGMFLRRDVLPPSEYLRDLREKDGFSAGSQLAFSATIKRDNLKKLSGFQVSLR